MIIKVITLLIVFFSSLYSLSEVIDEGLSYQIFKSPQKSMLGNSEIVVIQVDPNFYNINLFSSEQYISSQVKDIMIAIAPEPEIINMKNE